jgi:hypothetical protein
MLPDDHFVAGLKERCLIRAQAEVIAANAHATILAACAFSCLACGTTCNTGHRPGRIQMVLT